LCRSDLARNPGGVAESVLTAKNGLFMNGDRQVKKPTTLVSEDRLSEVNLKRHSVILPVQSSHAVF